MKTVFRISIGILAIATIAITLHAAGLLKQRTIAQNSETSIPPASQTKGKPSGYVNWVDDQPSPLIRLTTEPQAVFELALSNQGDAAIGLQPDDVQLETASSDSWKILSDSACFSVLLAPGDSCTVRISFQPTADGRHHASIRLPAYPFPRGNFWGYAAKELRGYSSYHGSQMPAGVEALGALCPADGAAGEYIFGLNRDRQSGPEAFRLVSFSCPAWKAFRETDRICSESPKAQTADGITKTYTAPAQSGPWTHKMNGNLPPSAVLNCRNGLVEWAAQAQW